MFVDRAAGLPWYSRRGGGFGRTAASLVHVVEDDVDKKVSRIVHAGSLDCEAAQIIRKTIPSVKLTEVNIVDLKSRDVLESMQRYCAVERELFITSNQASFVVRRKSQTRYLCKGRV